MQGAGLARGPTRTYHEQVISIPSTTPHVDIETRLLAELNPQRAGRLPAIACITHAFPSERQFYRAMPGSADLSDDKDVSAIHLFVSSVGKHLDGGLVDAAIDGGQVSVFNSVR